jgi:hypothetical protein
MKERDRESLKIQKELEKLFETHCADCSDPRAAFFVYLQMVWYGLNRMRSMWSELKRMGLPDSASWVDWTKPQIIKMMDRVEAVGWDGLQERRDKGGAMPKWIDTEGGEHHIIDEHLN